MIMSEAQANLEKLRANPYPGRGMAIGLAENGRSLVQAYWIMGRSEQSRNRVFGYENGRLFTRAANPKKVKDPRLIIYNAMDEWNGCYVVSNGDQTDTVIRGLRAGRGFYETMSTRVFEPDKPNYTPRIAAISYRAAKPVVAMAILKKSARGATCERTFYNFDEFERGFGFCLTTYSGDGDPLPAFQGVPFLLPLLGERKKIAETLWEALWPSNRVALAVKFVNIASGESTVTVINRPQKIS